MTPRHSIRLVQPTDPIQRPNPVRSPRVVAGAKRANVPIRQITPTTQPVLPAMILDDGTVRRLLVNDGLVNSIPILAPYAARLKAQQAAAPQRRGCGGCGGSTVQRVLTGQNEGIEYNAIRYHLVHTMSQDEKDRIKAALNVKQLRVYYLDTAGNKSRANV